VKPAPYGSKQYKVHRRAAKITRQEAEISIIEENATEQEKDLDMETQFNTMFNRRLDRLSANFPSPPPNPTPHPKVTFESPPTDPSPFKYLDAMYADLPPPDEYPTDLTMPRPTTGPGHDSPPPPPVSHCQDPPSRPSTPTGSETDSASEASEIVIEIDTDEPTPSFGNVSIRDISDKRNVIITEPRLFAMHHY
jgi:hypothetical protein